MKMIVYPLAGLALVTTAAHAQPAAEAAGPAAPADAADDAAPPEASAGASADAAAPADEAAPTPSAEAAAAGAANVTDADIENFAKATVKLQAIQADTAIAADQKQTAMAAAVAEVGLDPAKYNAIGKAAAADATLRAKVQTAMSKHAQPSDG